MTDSTKNWIIFALVLIILTGVFFLGYTRYPIWNGVPVATHDTISIHDTAWQIIPDTIPWLITKTDTVLYRDQKWIDSIIQANKVDTSAILKKYYAFHVYERSWTSTDTALKVTLRDVISENKYFDSDFSYQYLKPLQVIDNTTTTNKYSRYLYLGGSVTIPDSKWSNIAVSYASERGLFSAGYIPFQKGLSLGYGFKIIKLK